MLLRFALDHIKKELPQLLVARPRPERAHDIELEITSKTGPKLPITGEAQFVAALAKVKVGDRADESNALLATRNLVIGGRSVRAKFRFGNERAEFRLDRAARFRDGKKLSSLKTSVVLTGISSMKRRRRFAPRRNRSGS